MKLILAAVMLAQSAFAPLLSAQHWIGPPASAQNLAGKVVLVDVFTYSCINCKHVVPELRRLRRQYSGSDLAIIGIHTPELSSDFVRKNVVENLVAQGITWPVAIDNDQQLWRAYDVNAWPTQLIFDRHGILRKTVVGDSQDDAVADAVHTLVAQR